MLLLLCFTLLLFCATESVEAAPGQGQQQPVIDFLNQTIGWYRMVNAAQSLASEPADVVFLTQNRQLALESVRLAFQFAKSDVALASAQNQSGSAKGDSSTDNPNPQLAQAQNIAKLASQADADIKQAQTELDSLQSKLPTTRGKNLAVLRSHIAEKRSELDLLRTRSKALNSIAQFLNSPGMSGSKGLLGQIEELQRSVPLTSGGSNAQPEASPNASASQGAAGTQKQSTPAGVVAIGSDLTALTRKLHSERALLNRTNALRDSVNKLRAPLIEQVRSTAQQGTQLVEAPSTSDLPQLQARTQQIEELNAQFKQATDAAVPLGKMLLLLDSASVNISQWMDETQRVYGTEARALGLRLLILAFAISVILLASHFWKRATFRYVHDVRRRNQFMVLRRFTVMLAVAVIVMLALVAEIGSIATFAGFFTAGLAIALQNVILSVVAYFFPTGRTTRNSEGAS